MKLSTKRDVTNDTTSDTTSEEFSDIDNTSSDDDDLLFGDFGEDQTLNNPSSIKKHRTIESSLTRSNRITRLNSQNLSSINKKNDIFGPTKSSTNHLEKQLGFSLSRKTQESSVTKSQMFKKLLTEVKKEKEIGILIAGEKTEEENKIEIENKINHWIETRVDPKFLKAEVNGIDLNKKWISDLKKTLRKVIQANDMSFNEKLIDTEILKFPEYCNFRCFKSADNALGKPQKFGEFMFLEPSIKTLIHSTNIRYVENFELEWEGTENISCIDIYEALYLDSEIMNSKESVNISFDNKSLLPSLGCGFELLRFVQIINTTKYDIFSKEIVIRSLILLCSDFNVRSEINHYKYQGEYLTGRDIGVLKLKEFAEDPELLTILSQTLQLVPELWFEIIRQFTNTNYKKDIIFKGKLIVDFLARIHHAYHSSG